MGLHLAGLVEIPLLHRQWRLSAGPVGSTRPVGSAGLAGSTGPAGPASDRTGTVVPRPDQRTPGHRRALLMGLAFGAGWTPCIGPILGAVIGVASGETMADGALLLIAYCLGLGLPLLAVAGGAGVVGSRWSVLRRRAALVEVTSGAIVALTGVALVANLFGRLAATLPALGG
jgi:cytochrome c-type biogenesis protein